MKKWLFVFLLSGFCFQVQAQKIFDYTYDHAGNRVKRTVSYTLGSSQTKKTIDVPSNLSLSENTGGAGVEIRFRPDKDTFLVSVSDKRKRRIRIGLYKEGEKLTAGIPESVYAAIDMQGRTSGNYLLRINIGKAGYLWTIVKNNPE